MYLKMGYVSIYVHLYVDPLPISKLFFIHEMKDSVIMVKALSDFSIKGRDQELIFNVQHLSSKAVTGIT